MVASWLWGPGVLRRTAWCGKPVRQLPQARRAGDVHVCNGRKIRAPARGRGQAGWRHGAL